MLICGATFGRNFDVNIGIAEGEGELRERERAFFCWKVSRQRPLVFPIRIE
jgi:hypothetical protein